MLCLIIGQTTNADIQILRDFDRQMSQLTLGDLANEDVIPIFACLPAYEQCSQLFQTFKSRVHPVVPVCHLPSLENTLVRFWTDVTFTTTGDSLALLLSVVYAGSISSASKQNADLAVSIYTSYNLLLQKLAFPNDMAKATIPLLQSYLIVHSCRASQIEPLSSFGFLSPAVRVAQSLKLHLESRRMGNIDRQVKSRIWWHLIYLDVETSLISGLPVLIHEDDYTTKMPAKLDDVYIRDGMVDKTSENLAFSSMMIAMHGRWHWALQMRIWRRRKPTTAEFSAFKQTMADLSLECAESQEDPWAKSYLHLHNERAISSAARSFMDGKLVSEIFCDHEVLR